jgi:hypothetical protein
MANPKQEFADVVDIEFDADDITMIGLVHKHGFLDATDMHALPVLDPGVRSQLFRVPRELLVYVGFGLDMLSKEVDQSDLQQALQQTYKKVLPYIEGLAAGAENDEDEY